MTTVDIILLICFVPALWQGLSKGFIGQLFSIAAVVLGIWLAFHFSGITGGWLGGYIQADEKLLQVISFAAIVAIALIVLSLLGSLLTKVVKLVMLGWLNKLLGVVFALLKAALLLGLLITVFESANAHLALVSQEELDSSLVYNGIKNVFLQVFPYLKGLVTNA